VLNLQQAQAQTSDGYILEVFFPREMLNGLTLAENSSLGMNVSLSDADCASRGRKSCFPLLRSAHTPIRLPLVPLLSLNKKITSISRLKWGLRSMVFGILRMEAGEGLPSPELE
jgi:hypothetical protein